MQIPYMHSKVREILQYIFTIEIAFICAPMLFAFSLKLFIYILVDLERFSTKINPFSFYKQKLVGDCVIRMISYV